MVEFVIESKSNCYIFRILSYHFINIFREDRAPEYSLFVGDLSSDVDETFLLVRIRESNKTITKFLYIVRLSL